MNQEGDNYGYDTSGPKHPDEVGKSAYSNESEDQPLITKRASTNQESGALRTPHPSSKKSNHNIIKRVFSKSGIGAAALVAAGVLGVAAYKENKDLDNHFRGDQNTVSALITKQRIQHARLSCLDEAVLIPIDTPVYKAPVVDHESDWFSLNTQTDTRNWGGASNYITGGLVLNSPDHKLWLGYEKQSEFAEANGLSSQTRQLEPYENSTQIENNLGFINFTAMGINRRNLFNKKSEAQAGITFMPNQDGLTSCYWRNDGRLGEGAGEHNNIVAYGTNVDAQTVAIVSHNTPGISVTK
jgi:hypothetical protein